MPGSFQLELFKGWLVCRVLMALAREPVLAFLASGSRDDALPLALPLSRKRSGVQSLERLIHFDPC